MLEADPPRDASALGIGTGAHDRLGIRVARDDPRGARRARARTLLGLAPQRVPGGSIVAAPAGEAEPGAGERRRTILRDARALDRDRADAAQRVEQQLAGRGALGPLPVQQQRGRERLLERRGPLLRSPAATVQRCARQIDAETAAAPAHVGRDAQIGRLGVDRGARAEAIPHAIDDAILDELGGIARVRDHLALGDDVDHQRAVRCEVVLPRQLEREALQIVDAIDRRHRADGGSPGSRNATTGRCDRRTTADPARAGRRVPDAPPWRRARAARARASRPARATRSRTGYAPPWSGVPAQRGEQGGQERRIRDDDARGVEPNGAPAMVATAPPASRTSSAPAAQSHGCSAYSQ